MTAIATGTLVDYAGRVSDIAGTVVAIDTEYSHDEPYAVVREYAPYVGNDRAALTRRMPLSAIRPHRCGQLCDCD